MAVVEVEEVAEDVIYVIDDFLADPHAMRRLALEGEYPKPPQPETYAGRFSHRRYPIPNLDAMIGSITGHPVVPVGGVSSGHARFRVCLENEWGTGGVHIDNCHWTGVYYLTLDEHAQGGTDFFRHLPSNTRRAPVYPEDWKTWPYGGADRLHKDMLLPHTNDPSKWELVRRVPLKFNRLVLFNPWLWHAAGPGFGDDVTNARLIYVMSYNQLS